MIFDVSLLELCTVHSNFTQGNETIQKLTRLFANHFICVIFKLAIMYRKTCRPRYVSKGLKEGVLSFCIYMLWPTWYVDGKLGLHIYYSESTDI